MPVMLRIQLYHRTVYIVVSLLKTNYCMIADMLDGFSSIIVLLCTFFYLQGHRKESIAAALSTTTIRLYYATSS